MCYWVKKRPWLQMPVTPTLFTNEAADDAALKYSIEQDDIAKGTEHKQNITFHHHQYHIGK
jgi:hypothetical protein